MEKGKEDQNSSGLAARLAVERFSIGALFRDENDINEKSIIGFISFFLMVVFGVG